SLNQMLRMAIVRKKIDGGILFLKVYTGGGLLPFKLQALEVDELDTYQTLPKVPGNKVVSGIEYNPFNRPVGYWIKQYNLDGMSVEKTRFIEAKDVIFLYSKTRPSQVREMSDMTQTVTRIRDANEFMTAISVKERIMACLSVFIKKVIPTTGRGRANDDPQRTSYDGKTLVPGMIKELNAGDEVQVVNPAGQAADATEHMRLQQRMIGAGQGLSYEATSRDMSKTNYSSARSAILEDELTYIEEKEIIKDFLDEVYETFLISGVLSGLLDIPEFWSMKSEYFEHEWVSAPKRWIDPLKEANANKIALMTGQKTFKQIAAENGKDYREQIEEMEDVLKFAHDLGIELGGILYGKSKEELYTEDSEGR
ncbi:MAG: phage portal protein, partial [Eubacterium sp.]